MGRYLETLRIFVLMVGGFIISLVGVMGIIFGIGGLLSGMEIIPVCISIIFGFLVLALGVLLMEVGNQYI